MIGQGKLLFTDHRKAIQWLSPHPSGWWVPHLPALAMLLVVLHCSPGCRTTNDSTCAARHAYSVGDLDTAHQTLIGLADGPKRTRYESRLDLAMVELALGEAESAESRLRGLRDHFDSLPSTSIVNNTASLATDDNARAFQIEEYEQVLLRSLLAICSLANDAIDAEAYCLQAQSRQKQIDRDVDAVAAGPDTENLPLRWQVALAPYLHGTLREATHQNYDDAERAFRLVSNIQPDFAPAVHDVQRVSSGEHSSSGHGVVYVIAFVGNGPRLVETVAPTTTASLQIASTLLQAVGKQEKDDDGNLVLPNVASVKVPVVDFLPTSIAAVGVSFDGQFLGATQTLTDVGRLAVERVESQMPWTIARAVARRVVKEASVSATSKSLGLTGDTATVFQFAAASAWSGAEHADTRCWGLLPRQIQVLRAELPIGVQSLDFMPMSPVGEVYAEPSKHQVTIEDGRNHYLIVVAPEQIVSIVP